MKTEHHTLVAKDPKDLPEFIQQLAPYWRVMAGVLVLAILGSGALAVISTSRKKSQEAGWTAYLNAAADRDPSALEKIASLGKSDVNAWAQHAAAQAKLIEATTLVHTDRATAKSRYQEAIEDFNKALDLAPSQALIRKLSLWGLAQSHEGLNELGKAKDFYKQIVDKWPDSSIAKQAQTRIESLNEPATQEFYNWFFAQEPPSRLPATGEMAPFNFEAPSTPDFEVPDPTGMSVDSTDDVSADQFPTESLESSLLDDLKEPAGQTPPAHGPAPTDPAPTDPAPTDPATADPAPVDLESDPSEQ